MSRPVVEVFADVACPFAHVGLRRVVRRRVELGVATPVLRVRAWPLELVNGVPLDPASVARHVAEIREQVEPGLFRGFDPARFPRSSLPALALTAHAYTAGDETGEQMSLALRDALFEEGADIADRQVLSDFAARFGLTAPGPTAEEAVLADLAEGRRRGVLGSPEFFLGEHGYFCPALSISSEGGHLVIVANPAVFDEFLDRCFA